MTIIAILIQEHKLIERVVKILDIICQKDIKPVFLDEFIDFFRTYADKRHHGKEEDIFFKSLALKPMPVELKKTINALIEEHKKARKLMKDLEELKGGSRKEIQECIKKIIQLYTSHIEKENYHFFVPAFNLFEKKQQKELLKRAEEFDRSLTHKDYKIMVLEMEKTLSES